jgi:TnpA family transposase
MGSRLFPAILGYLTEQFEDRPMLDKLNRLEKLGFIDSVEQWQTVRNIRNKFAHDYPDDPNKNAAHLNFALESVSVLYAMLTTISTQLNTAYPLLELGKALPAYLHD